MKKLIYLILIILLCIFSFALISCGGEDDTTTTADPDLYNITYELNGGTNNENNPATYKTGDSFELAVPTKEDGLFLGWYTDSGFENFVKEIKDDSVGDITLYAKWGNLESILSFELVGDSYYVTNCFRGQKYLYIPSSYKGVPVIGIGPAAFEGNGSIYVYVPDSITVIQNSAFKKCDDLVDIRLSNNLTELGSAVFSGCSSLKAIDLPDSLTKIGNLAFTNSGITSIIIPDKVESIGYDTFYECEFLSDIHLSKNLNSIGIRAFVNCPLLKSITVDEENTSYKSVDGVLYSKDGKTLIYYPSGKTETEYTILNGTEIIGSKAFICNPYIKNINIPNTVKEINRIYSCTALKSLVIPNSVTKIDAFSFCSSLESITLSSNIEVIPTYAFQGCSSLKSVVIPNGVKSIGNFAFYKCTSLESAVISESVIEVNYDIFNRCDSLNIIYCEAESKPDGWHDRWNRFEVEVVWGYKGEE